MGRHPYQFKRLDILKYTFTSVGKSSIKKIVLFDTTSRKGVFQLGFGDLNEDGEIDDMANSNNGDIVKVLSTIIVIIMDFLKEYPNAKIVFSGSTAIRMTLYQRIVKKHYKVYEDDYVVSGLLQVGLNLREVPLEPNIKANFLAFFIKKNN